MICDPCLALLKADLEEAERTRSATSVLTLCSEECERSAIELMRFDRHVVYARGVPNGYAMPQCGCGRPIHYTDGRIAAAMMELVEQVGEFVTVQVAGLGSWRVSRHYIALHGLIAADLPASTFEKLTP